MTATRGVNKLQFWGERDRPMSRDDLLQATPILSAGKPSTELAELSSARYLYVNTTSKATKPKLEITEVESGEGGTVWRIAVPDEPGHKVGHRLGRTATFQTPEAIHAAVDANIDFTGHRPDGADQFFIPRSLPGPYNPRMRRINGRPVRPLYVFGSDDRTVYQDTSYPWRCVGKLYNSDGLMGSASLVGGDLIVTAGHMVPWNSINAGSWWMRFVPDYFDGQSLAGAGVESYVSDINGYNVNNHVTGYDWAIGKLYTRLGDSLGYFGFNGYSSDWEDRNYWTVAGYPAAVASGERPSWQGSISIHDDDGDSNGGQELESQTADISGGDSGGPIFAWWNGDPRLIGVVSGEEEEYQFPFSSQDNNVFASGSGFCNLIAWGRSNW